MLGVPSTPVSREEHQEGSWNLCRPELTGVKSPHLVFPLVGISFCLLSL